MDYLESFSINLPPFIERSYDISPGVVSVVFKVIWSIFSFIVVAVLVHFGLSALWIEKSETGSRQKSLWQLHNEYSQVQSVSNGSIGNAYVARYHGTTCVGRVNNFTQLNTTMWNTKTVNDSGNLPPQNSTLLRQLLNTKQIGNFALLGNGTFVISPTDSLYAKGQQIKVARSGFNCSSTINLDAGASKIPIYKPTSVQTLHYVATLHYPNISLNDDLPTIDSEHVFVYIKGNLSSVIPSGNFDIPVTLDTDKIVLMLLGYNRKKGTSKSNIYLSECSLFYEYGVVTIAENGYLNQTNIGDSYTKSDDKTPENDFDYSNIYNHLLDNKNFYSTLDMPDEFLNADYNKSYSETMERINDIMSAHLINGLDPYSDPCTFNQEAVPVYFSVIGTKMSFGYIIVGIIFALITLSILLALSFILFTPEERKRWDLYSNDYCFEGFIFTGDATDKREFKLYAMNTYPRVNKSSRTSEDNEETELDPKSPL